MANSFLAKGEQQARTGTLKIPPVEHWDPSFCGDIDMRIAKDGTWFYCGTPIARLALVRLFSSILRKDPDGYVLVTPVEKVGIMVEDAPFIAVEMTVGRFRDEQVLRFSTSIGDHVEAGGEHPIRFEKAVNGGLKPYIHIRGGLWALVSRALLFDLAALGEIREHEGARCFGVVSAGVFFAMADAKESEAIEAANR